MNGRGATPLAAAGVAEYRDAGGTIEMRSRGTSRLRIPSDRHRPRRRYSGSRYSNCMHLDRVLAAAATFAAPDLADDDLAWWPAEAECSVCGERYAVPEHEAGDDADDEPVCPPCRMDAERAGMVR